MKNNVSEEQIKKPFFKSATFLNKLAPILLFSISFITAIYSGLFLANNNFLKALSFALSIFFIIGMHGLGHFIIARAYGVASRPPYFIPCVGLGGTLGAFTKMIWPINDRKVLLRIFSSGPICGFIASLIIFSVGLSMSEIVEKTQINSFVVNLGDSCMTYLMIKVFFGTIRQNQDIVFHPVAFAGWIGFLYNLWHLFPVGRLDGGRIIYGLWGYRITKIISIIFLVGLAGLSYFWHKWIGLVAFGVICMITFKRQYEFDKYHQQIGRLELFLSSFSFIILIITFIPIPISFGNL